MNLTVTIGSRRITATDIDYSSVDPGGCESAAIKLSKGQPPNPGEEVLIWDGTTCVFEGEVEEPGQRHSQGSAPVNVTAVGKGAIAKRRKLSMIFIDRDMSVMGPPSVQREINLADNASGFILDDGGGWTVAPDEVTGRPSIRLKFTNMVTLAARHPIIEPWYDAGIGNSISKIKGDYRTYDKSAGGINTLAGNWFNQVVLGSDDVAAVNDVSGDLGGSGSFTVTATAARRYAYFQLFFNAITAAGAGDWQFIIDNMRVIGDHGLALAGSGATEGVYPQDVVAYVLGRMGLACDIEINAQSSYAVPHLTYRDPTDMEQIWSDMGVLLGGWHWGVWPRRLLSTQPTFIFRPPPVQPTAAVSYTDLKDPDITEQFSAMHNRAIVLYNKANGTQGKATVDVPHPRIPDGVISETIINIGVSTAAAAEQQGRFILQAQQLNQRVSGIATLPVWVRGVDGGLIKSSTLRAGLDRIRILGLPLQQSMVSDQAQRADTFRLRRVSSSSSEGTTRTQVEFDTGADLIETLNARLAAEAPALGG